MICSQAASALFVHGLAQFWKQCYLPIITPKYSLKINPCEIHWFIIFHKKCHVGVCHMFRHTRLFRMIPCQCIMLFDGIKSSRHRSIIQALAQNQIKIRSTSDSWPFRSYNFVTLNSLNQNMFAQFAPLSLASWMIPLPSCLLIQWNQWIRRIPSEAPGTHATRSFFLGVWFGLWR